MRFAGKVAIVTGGSAGLGAAIALRLGQEGAAVVIADPQSPIRNSQERGHKTGRQETNLGLVPIE